MAVTQRNHIAILLRSWGAPPVGAALSDAHGRARLGCAARRAPTMRFNIETAELYQPFKDGMAPAYLETVRAARMAKPDAECILDLCSGLGEPACSLAKAFPQATVTCSDASPAMVEKAMQYAAKQRIRLDGCVMEMEDLSQVEASSQDIVTANFGLMYTTDPSKVLREVLRVLKPGGFLIGTVWQKFALVPLVTATMAEVIQSLQAQPQQLPPPGTADFKEPTPLNVRLGPPIDPMALADANMLDLKLAGAGFVPMEGHNSLGRLKIDLGQAFGKKTWKVGCTPVLGTLSTMREEETKKAKKKKVDVFKLAKAAFDKARAAPPTNAPVCTPKGCAHPPAAPLHAAGCGPTRVSPSLSVDTREPRCLRTPSLLASPHLWSL